MSIPTYDRLMLPVLKLCAGKTWLMRDLVAHVADDLALSDAERAETIPSGFSTIASRVHWAKTYLKKAGLLEQPKRGTVQITESGRKVLADNPPSIDAAYLRRFDSFVAFFPQSNRASGQVAPIPSNESVDTPSALAGPTSSTPEEQISSAADELNRALRDALLARILDSPPAFFERLIVDLLLSMGYGGSQTDAGEQLGGTADGGVDGVIREDQLGLDRIYLQAKRYQPGNIVGSEAIHAFMGALLGKGSQKGVFITTSAFTKSALQVARQPGHLRLVLIDGDELTKLMVRFGVGVRAARTIEIKRIDPEYFGDVEPE